MPISNAQKLRYLLLPVITRIPAYTRLAWAVMRDARVGKRQKALLLGGIAYLISPIDLIPGFIPLVGQLDDLTVVLWTLRAALRGVPDELATEHFRAHELSWDILDADLADTAKAGGLIALLGFRFGTRVAGTVGGALLGLGRRLLQSRL